MNNPVVKQVSVRVTPEAMAALATLPSWIRPMRLLASYGIVDAIPEGTLVVFRKSSDNPHNRVFTRSIHIIVLVQQFHDVTAQLGMVVDTFTGDEVKIAAA